MTWIRTGGRSRRTWIAMVVCTLAVLARPDAPSAHPLTCPGAATLEDLVACVRQHMPDKSSAGFVVPDAAAQSDWQAVVTQMLAGHCGDLNPLPATFQNSYAVAAFNDAGNGGSYCVLMEVTGHLDGNDFKVDRGWGTFITNPTAARELSIQVPHALFETDTEAEGIGVFKQTNSRSFLMAGTHRCANPTPGCQSSSTQGECPGDWTSTADVSHHRESMFQPSIEAMLAFYAADPPGETFAALQFHGNAQAACPDVFMTYGVNVPPPAGSKLLTLQTELKKNHPTWAVMVPGDPTSCSLKATENVQGRRLNGVAAGAVCLTSAASASSRFIHVEQKAGEVRNPDNWICAVKETWPPNGASDVCVDVQVRKGQSSETVTVGDTLTYLIGAGNAGPSTATGIVLTDPLPASVTFVSTTCAPGYDAAMHKVTCDIGSLGFGTSAVFAVVVTPTVPGTILNTATATSNGADLDPSNNAATAQTTVLGPPPPPPPPPPIKQQIDKVMRDVQTLVAAGILSAGEGRSLVAKLSAALIQFARGNAHPAINELNAYINAVEALRRSRRLPADRADALIADAQAILRGR